MKIYEYLTITARDWSQQRTVLNQQEAGQFFYPNSYRDSICD